jgi:pSer/pThr/pTyr-binding forkhead associated (FHA) protein
MSARVTFKATEGPLSGESFAFTGRAQCVVGRSPDCAVRLSGEDPTVSRHHCLLEVDAPAAWVQDLGSLNGTFVNGEDIGHRTRRTPVPARAAPPHAVGNGDEVRVGNSVFTVAVEEEEETDEVEGALRRALREAVA